nr:hypothetical protein [Oceanococcus sp. HetDA_MAG_MS8]
MTADRKRRPRRLLRRSKGEALHVYIRPESSIESGVNRVVLKSSKRSTTHLSDHQISSLKEAIDNYCAHFTASEEEKKLKYRFVSNLAARKRRPFFGFLKNDSPSDLLEVIDFEASALDALAEDWVKVGSGLSLAIASEREKLRHE